jgi:excinuclease UvrABC nuclease subunit
LKSKPTPACRCFFMGWILGRKIMSKWKIYGLFPKEEKLPSKPCVYAIYVDDRLIYIGQTTSLSNRFSGHAFRYGYAKNIITPWCEFPSTSKITIKAKFSEKLGDWAMWEIRLIRKIKPFFNTHHLNKRKDGAK